MDFLGQWMRGSSRRTRRVFLPLLILFAAACLALAADSGSRAQTEDSPPAQQPQQQRNALQASPEGQSQADVDRKNAGCVSCHTATDQPTMHPTGTVRLACIDCHGGDSSVHVPPGAQMGSAEYEDAKNRAHPKSAIPEWARSSANPVRPYTEWLRENYDYIRFINPGDLRVAPQTCGQSGCHVSEVRRVQTSLMTTGSILWGAALYNNGAFPLKRRTLRRKLFGRRHTTSPARRPTADARGNAHEGNPPGAHAARALGNFAARQRPARLRARRRKEGRDRQSESRGRIRPAGRQAQRSRFRHRAAHRSRFPRPAKNAPPRSPPLPAGHQRRARRLSRQRLHRLPRRLRQRPLARSFRPVRHLRKHGPNRHLRSHDPENRIGPSDSPLLHASDSFKPVHGLPCPSRHEHGNDLLRLHLVGQRSGRRVHVSAEAEKSDRGRALSSRAPKSRACRRTRPVVRSEVPFAASRQS